MLTGKNYTRELLYRKGNYKAYIESYYKKLQFLFPECVEGIDFLSLERSDCVRYSLNNENSKIIQNAIEQSPNETEYFLVSALSWVGESYYLFINGIWRYCGALLNTGSLNLNLKFQFPHSTIDDLVFISHDCSRLYHIDYWEYGNTEYLDVTKKIKLLI